MQLHFISIETSMTQRLATNCKSLQDLNISFQALSKWTQQSFKRNHNFFTSLSPVFSTFTICKSADYWVAESLPGWSEASRPVSRSVISWFCKQKNWKFEKTRESEVKFKKSCRRDWNSTMRKKTRENEVLKIRNPLTQDW